MTHVYSCVYLCGEINSSIVNYTTFYKIWGADCLPLHLDPLFYLMRINGYDLNIYNFFMLSIFFVHPIYPTFSVKPLHLLRSTHTERHFF